MKTQQRVELKYGHGDEKPQGTVSKVFWNGDFKVSFDTTWSGDRPGEGKRIPGGRYTYKAAQATSFVVLG